MDLILQPLRHKGIRSDIKTGITRHPLSPVPIIHPRGHFNDAPPCVGPVGGPANSIGDLCLPDALMRTCLDQHGRMESQL